MTTAHGIYEYDGSELGAPGPSWTELLTDSIEAALVQVDSDIAALDTQADSGWTLISTFGTGWSATAGNPPRVRRVGSRVDLTGSVTRATTVGLITDLLTIPVGFRMAGAYSTSILGATVTSGATAHILTLVNTTHKVSAPYGPAIGSGIHMPVVGSWYVD